MLRDIITHTVDPDKFLQGLWTILLKRAHNVLVSPHAHIQEEILTSREHLPSCQDAEGS